MITFARHAPPSWVGADGLPASWRHWVYGMAWINREHHRDQLKTAQALRFANTDPEHWGMFQRDVEMMTGVPR